jgi:hypothetical protein
LALRSSTDGLLWGPCWLSRMLLLLLAPLTEERCDAVSAS